MKMLLKILVVGAAIGACGRSEFSARDRRGGESDAAGASPRAEPNAPKDLSQDYPGIADGGGANGQQPPKPGGPEESVREYNLSCSQLANPVHPVIEVNESAGRKIVTRLSGEFCPAATNALRAVFVVDFSASMGKHDIPSQNIEGHPGHDPLVNGTCGRLEAIKTIIDKLKTSGTPAQNIEVAFVPFAGGVVKPYEVAPVKLDTFANQYVQADRICRFTLQRSDKYNTEPGALLPQGFNASTQYDPAFRRAKAFLDKSDLQGVLYFITDGEPTDAGSGFPAIKELAALPNLTVNSLLLSHDATNARHVLEQLTLGNDPERVKDVAKAADLKIAISDFKDPEIDLKSGGAVLKVAPYPDTEIGLVPTTSGANFEKIGNVYRYVAQPFVLLGRPGEVVENFVEVRATGTDGRVYQSLVEIKYTMLP